MLSKYLEAGKIVGTHGVRGEMRVQPWSDDSFLIKFKTFYLDKQGNEKMDVISIKNHGNVCLLKAKGVDDIAVAETYRNKIIYIDRADAKLEKGQYFISDIIGCTAYNVETNEILGEISDVSKTGANDVWHIKKDGNEYFVANVPEFIKEVDIGKGTVKISVIKGMFDDED